VGIRAGSGTIVADPAGEERCSQEGSAEKEDPDAELAGEAGEALFFNQGFAGPPYQWSEYKENDQHGSQAPGRGRVCARLAAAS
jgi:hypothetical protein